MILFSATYLSNIKVNFDSLSNIRTGILDRHKFITFIDIRIFDPPKIVFNPFFVSSGQVCACFSFKFENCLSCPLFSCKLDYFSSSKNEAFSPKIYIFGWGGGISPLQLIYSENFSAKKCSLHTFTLKD